jgi:putative copper export protein
MNHHFLLILHLISASIWVGGHLILWIMILPKALKQKEPNLILRFEQQYEALGMSSLVLLVITGVWMAYHFNISVSDWFSFSSPLERMVSLKLTLLISTVLFAISAQARVIPKLKYNPDKLPEMALHITVVTLLGVAMLMLGSLARFGGI